MQCLRSPPPFSLTQPHSVIKIHTSLQQKTGITSACLISLKKNFDYIRLMIKLIIISYKILLLAFKALNGLAPAYLTNLLLRYNPTRSLRSHNSGLLVVPRKAKSTKGGRTFSYVAPKLWNSLPDNMWGSDTLSLFKSRLKTHLFSQAFI